MEEIITQVFWQGAVAGSGFTIVVSLATYIGITFYICKGKEK